MLVYLVDPAHLVSHLAALALRRQAVLHGTVHLLHELFQPDALVQGHSVLEGTHAVIPCVGGTHGVPRVGGIGILDGVLAQILSQRDTQQAHEGAEGLDAVLHAFGHQILFGEPDSDAVHGLLAGLHHLPLHRSLVHDLQRILLHQLCDVVGRAAGDGRVGKGGTVAQVTVQLQDAGEEGRYPVAVRDEVKPVKVHGILCAVQGKEVAVRLLRHLPHHAVRVDKAGLRVRFQKGFALFPHQPHPVIGGSFQRGIQRLLQQGRIHRVLQGELIPGAHFFPAEIVHDALKDILRRTLCCFHRLTRHWLPDNRPGH